jgi:hypothetical protein
MSQVIKAVFPLSETHEANKEINPLGKQTDGNGEQNPKNNIP